MRFQHGQLMKKTDTVFIRFAHADDSPATDRDSRFPDMFKRTQPVFVGVCRDDLPVKLRGRIEIVVVCVESRLGKPSGLRSGEHAQGAADFKAERSGTPDHFENCIELRAFTNLAPCRPHTETADTLVAGALRRLQNAIDRQQVVPVESGVIVGTLRAIPAVFRTSSRFYGEKLAELDFAGIEVLTVNALRAEQEINEPGVVNRTHLRAFHDGHAGIMACAVHPYCGNFFH